MNYSKSLMALLLSLNFAVGTPYYSYKEDIEDFSKKKNISSNLTIPTSRIKARLDSDRNGNYDSLDVNYKKIAEIAKNHSNPHDAFLFYSALFALGEEPKDVKIFAEIAQKENDFLEVAKKYYNVSGNHKNSSNVVRLFNVANSIDEFVSNPFSFTISSANKDISDEKYLEKYGIANYLLRKADKEVFTDKNADLVLGKTEEGITYALGAGSKIVDKLLGNYLSEVENSEQEIRESEHKIINDSIVSDTTKKISIDDDQFFLSKDIFDVFSKYIKSLKEQLSFTSSTDKPLKIYNALEITEFPFVDKRVRPTSFPWQDHCRTHNGTDWIISGDGLVRAWADGEVYFADYKAIIGNMVSIYHGEFKKNNHSYETKYGHMSELYVKKGQKVKAGQIIGKMGGTGGKNPYVNIYSPHVHTIVMEDGKIIMDKDYIEKIVDGYTKISNRGYPRKCF